MLVQDGKWPTKTIDMQIQRSDKDLAVLVANTKYTQGTLGMRKGYSCMRLQGTDAHIHNPSNTTLSSLSKSMSGRRRPEHTNQTMARTTPYPSARMPRPVTTESSSYPMPPIIPKVSPVSEASHVGFLTLATLPPSPPVPTVRVPVVSNPLPAPIWLAVQAKPSVHPWHC
jgi:hypothetical protein